MLVLLFFSIPFFPLLNAVASRACGAKERIVKYFAIYSYFDSYSYFLLLFCFVFPASSYKKNPSQFSPLPFSSRHFMASLGPFKRCSSCPNRLPLTKKHSQCLFCLGEAHPISTCVACKTLTKQAFHLHRQHLKYHLWGKSLLPMETADQQAVDHPPLSATQSAPATVPLHSSSKQQQPPLASSPSSEDLRQREPKPAFSDSNASIDTSDEDSPPTIYHHLMWPMYIPPPCQKTSAPIRASSSELPRY